MKPNEKRAFADLLAGLLDIYGRVVTPAAASLWWAAFEKHSIQDVSAAFSRYTQDPEQGRYPPTPAAVLSCLPIAPGQSRLSADEAWSFCLRSFDEADTAIMNEAIDAGRAAALPVWEIGDKIGARMAFRAAYERAVSSGQRLTWRLSLGHDRAKREHAAEQAVSAGWLTRDAVREYLPAPEAKGAGAVIAGMLTGKVVPIRGDLDERTRERLAALRAVVSRRRDDGGGELVAEDRERFESRKRRELQRLDVLIKRGAC